MKTQDQLYLVLAKEWFTEILEGRKHEEYRAFTEFYISRLCDIDENGQIADTKKYKTVKFQQGYQKNAPQMIVEVTDIFIENDEDVHPENGDFLTTDNCNFVIALGEILEKKNC